TAVTLIQQDALQAAIWRTEYGTGFQLDGVDNANPAPVFNSTVGAVYKADLAALGSNTAPVGNVVWISPGTNPDNTQVQGLVVLSGVALPSGAQDEPSIAVNPTNPNDVFMVGEHEGPVVQNDIKAGGLWAEYSTDGGRTWPTQYLIAGGSDGLPKAAN